MKTTYYIFSQGKLSKKDHSIFFESRDEDTGEPFSRFLPIENISHIYSFSHLGVNSALLNFLGKKGISLHFLYGEFGIKSIFKPMGISAFETSTFFNVKLKEKKHEK